MMDYLSDEFGVFHLWTSFNRTTLIQWADHDVTYTLPDIVTLLEQMQYTLFQSNNSTFVSREFTALSCSCELKTLLSST